MAPDNVLRKLEGHPETKTVAVLVESDLNDVADRIDLYTFSTPADFLTACRMLDALVCPWWPAVGGGG